MGVLCVTLSCEECFGPTAQDCYSCSFKEGSSYNGTHCVTCGPNCVTCSGVNPNHCLTCDKGFLLSNTNTCININQCSYSLIPAALPSLFCEIPCDPSKFSHGPISCQVLCDSYTPSWSSLVDFAVQQCGSCNQDLSSAWSTTCTSVCNVLFTTAEFIPTYTASSICRGKYINSTLLSHIIISLPYYED